MRFEFLDDPGVKIRNAARRKFDAPSEIDQMKAETSKGDSIVQKWSVVFEKLWYVGHIAVMTSSIISILTCLSRQVLKPLPRLLYRATFVCIVFTYSVSLLQNLNGATPGFYALLPLETFQCIIMAALWTVTTPHTIKLISFSSYSLLHVADAASSHHEGSKSRRKIADKLSDNLAPSVIDICGYLDMWLSVELLRDCILIRSGAVISSIVFGFFYRVKLMSSPATMDAFMNVYHHIDRYMVDEKTHKRLRELWIRFRNKVEPQGVNHSDLYQKDTDDAIEMANIYNSLSKVNA